MLTPTKADMLLKPNAAAASVLYVEDDDNILELGRIALAEIGDMIVMACNTSVEALSVLETFQPDILLFDVIMPGMDGPALLQEIRRKQKSDAPVIFMTTCVDYADVKRYRDLGAIAVVKKPFDPLTLADELMKILRKTSAHQASTSLTPLNVDTADNIELFSRLTDT